jgi:opacity protein-like surface antigen
LIIVIACVAVLAASADAQSYTTSRPGGREGHWEFYLPLTYADSATIEGEGGSSVKINGDWGFGFGFGYNLTDRFQLNGLFNWNSRTYDATLVDSTGPQRYSNWLETSTLSLNGIFYLLDGDITPFVSGGIGYTYVDTNIQNGVASGGCWADWYWGWVCGTYVPTKTENDISYNAGIGIRFDLDRKFSLQGSYNKAWIDIGKAAGGMPEFDSWRLDFIFRM